MYEIGTVYMLAVGEQQALVSRVEIHVKFLGFGFYFHGRKGLVFEIKTRATIIDTFCESLPELPNTMAVTVPTKNVIC